MLASPASSLGLVASSSEAMRLLELFELQEQEGPCLDAFRTGERVGHENPGCRVRPLAVVFRRCPPGRLPVGVSPMSPGPPSTAPSIRWPGPPYNTGSMFPRRWRVRPAEWRAAVVIGHDHRAGVRLELDERVPERGGRGVLTAHGDHRRPGRHRLGGHGDHCRLREGRVSAGTDPVGGYVGAAEPVMPPFGTGGSDLGCRIGLHEDLSCGQRRVTVQPPQAAQRREPPFLLAPRGNREVSRVERTLRVQPGNRGGGFHRP